MSILSLVGAGEDVDLSVVFDEETEIVRSLGEIRGAAWPPAMSRPRTRSGGRVGDLRRMEEEMQDSLQDVEDGEDIFRYRPLDESELEEWQARQSQELQLFSNTGVDAEENFLILTLNQKKNESKSNRCKSRVPSRCAHNLTHEWYSRRSRRALWSIVSPRTQLRQSWYRVWRSRWNEWTLSKARAWPKSKSSPACASCTCAETCLGIFEHQECA
jgi:hypothetical protein